MTAFTPFAVRTPKIAQRYQLIGLYKHLMGRDYLPYNKLFLTLGGLTSDEYGELMPESELATLLNEEFIEPHQYVSVERNKKVWQQNSELKMEGPRFIRANIRDLDLFSELDSVEIINVDLMTGVAVALDQGIPQQVVQHAPKGCLIHFNFIAFNRRVAVRMGGFMGEGRSVRPELMSEPTFAMFANKLRLEFDSVYDSRAYGPGAHVTRMSSLVFQKVRE